MLAAKMGAVHLVTMAAARHLAKSQTIDQQNSASNTFNKYVAVSKLIREARASIARVS
jgi:hypothetical protein